MLYEYVCLTSDLPKFIDFVIMMGKKDQTKAFDSEALSENRMQNFLKSHIRERSGLMLHLNYL